MAFDEARRKAFDFAADATKQVLTLSTGILALTITFTKDILGGVAGNWSALLGWSWTLYIISIFLGVCALLALTGSLEPKLKPGAPVAEPSIRGTNVTIPSFLQLGLFVFATGLLVWFALTTPRASRPGPSDPGPGPGPSSSGPALTFELVGNVGPFVSGNPKTLEAAAANAGTTVEAVLTAMSNHLKTRQIFNLMVVGSADKFELGTSLRGEYGSNAGLARARAEWVGARLSSPQARDWPGYVALTVGPSKHGRGLSVQDTQPDRSVAIYAAFVKRQ